MKSAKDSACPNDSGPLNRERVAFLGEVETYVRYDKVENFISLGGARRGWQLCLCCSPQRVGAVGRR